VAITKSESAYPSQKSVNWATCHDENGGSRIHELLDWLTSTRLNPLDRSLAILRRNHHRLARDMTGRGLIINTTTKSSQIKGHVHGWIVGSAARENESQKAQQRAARAMEGIYDGASSVCLHSAAKPPRNAPQNTPDDQDGI